MKTCKVTSIEAVLTVDNKGQILLPKDLREKANINAGDKLIVIAGCDESGEICCLILIRSDLIDKELKSILSPLLKGVLQ